MGYDEWCYWSKIIGKLDKLSSNSRLWKTGTIVKGLSGGSFYRSSKLNTQNSQNIKSKPTSYNQFLKMSVKQ